jgi:hypothetical protein
MSVAAGNDNNGVFDKQLRALELELYTVALKDVWEGREKFQ